MTLQAIKLQCFPYVMGEILTGVFPNDLSKIYQYFLCNPISEREKVLNKESTYQGANLP